MSFLDKVTKAVGDVVDKGKKDVDQFLKIQKINGEIGGFEKKIERLEAQIGEATKLAGTKALELVRSGAIASPDLQAFVDQIVGLEQQIAEEQSNIVAKTAEIERVRAEHEASQAAPAAPVPPLPQAEAASPVTPPPIPKEPTTPAAAPATPPGAPPPPPETAGASKFCTECGAVLTGGAFCSQCGARL